MEKVYVCLTSTVFILQIY